MSTLTAAKTRLHVNNVQAAHMAQCSDVRLVTTSQTYSTGGHTSTDNRKTQAFFNCIVCGHHENAGINAIKNILNSGVLKYGDMGRNLRSWT